MYGKQGKHSPCFAEKEGDFTLNIRYDDKVSGKMTIFATSFDL